jgi:hypothetical protein
LIFVVFFVPLALYLLVLGHVNRRPRPVIVSGTWDFIGVLFAASGFLLCGGPAVLSALDERLRLFWLVGEGGRESLAGAGQVSLLLFGLYFLVVVVGSALIFWRQRSLTSIYNVEPVAVEETVMDACEHLGLDPIRSGNLFVFGLTLEGPGKPALLEGIQAPHSLARTGQISAGAPAGKEGAAGAEEFAGQNAILELEPFAACKHVTLRWDPHDSPLRPVLETELDQRLGLAGSPDHDTGLWLTMSGYGLMSVSLAIVFVMVLRTWLAR